MLHFVQYDTPGRGRPLGQRLFAALRVTKPKSPLLRQRFFARRLLQDDGENASGLEIFVPLGQRLFAALRVTKMQVVQQCSLLRQEFFAQSNKVNKILH